MKESIRGIIREIQNAKFSIFKDWKHTVDHLMISEINNFGVAEPLKEALDDAISQKHQFGSMAATINASYPNYPNSINTDRYEVWKSKANPISNNYHFWQNQIQSIIDEIDEVTNDQRADKAEEFNDVFELIVDALIEIYEMIAQPLWDEFFELVNQIGFYVEQYRRLENVSVETVEQFIDLCDSFWEVLKFLMGCFQIVWDAITEQSLSELLGLGPQTKAVFSSTISCLDALGLDDASSAIEAGNDLGILGDDTAEDLEEDLDDFEEAALSVEEISRELGADYRRLKEIFRPVYDRLRSEEDTEEALKGEDDEELEEEKALKEDEETIESAESMGLL